MKKTDILWNPNGWTRLQDADAEEHKLELTCRAENGVVVEMRVRHNDGEEKPGVVTIDGEPALPMQLAAFKKAFLADWFEIR